MESLLNIDDTFFVAGHRGMAGSAIVRALQKKGYNNILTASRQDLDLLDESAVNDWFKINKPSVVILAAAKVGGIHANNTYPADFLLENLKIQINVIESAWKNNVRRLLFLGSSCIYPKYSDQPIREESLLRGSLEPTNDCYAIAKIAGIKLCESLRNQYSFDAISLMPTNLYGPGDNYHIQNSHVLPALIRKFHEAKISQSDSVVCWGTGSALREFLYSDDLGEASVFALQHWSALAPNPPSGEDGKPLSHLNAGTGVDLSIRELAEEVSKVVGFKGTIEWDLSKPDGTPKKQLDVSRLTKLGWTAKTPLASGIYYAYNDFLDRWRRGQIK